MMARVIAVWLMLAGVAMAGTINSQPTIPGPLRATDATAVGRVGAATAYKMTVGQLVGISGEVYAGFYLTLADADAAAVATGARLVVSSQWDTVPSAMTAAIKILPGGKLNNLGPLAIHGRFEGAAGCFGTGAVTFTNGAVDVALPEWWIKNVLPGTTDMRVAIQSAADSQMYDSVTGGYGGTTLLNGRYYISGPVYLRKGMKLKVANNRTLLFATGNYPALAFRNTVAPAPIAAPESVEIEGVAIYGSGNATHTLNAGIECAGGAYRCNISMTPGFIRGYRNLTGDYDSTATAHITREGTTVLSRATSSIVADAAITMQSKNAAGTLVNRFSIGCGTDIVKFGLPNSYLQLGAVAGADVAANSIFRDAADDKVKIKDSSNVAQTVATVSAGGVLYLSGSIKPSGTTITINDTDSAAGSTRILAASGNYTNAAGTLIGVDIAPKYSQAASTAMNIDLRINRTETAIGSGLQRFISAGSGGVEKFGVSNTGIVNAGGGSANHAICWKSDGKTLGYCSAVVAADGTCGVCN